MEKNNTFQIERYSSIEEAYMAKKSTWEKLTNKDLVLADLDGVIIMWPFSIHTYLFKIRKQKLEALENIIKYSSAWIFTDRPKLVFNPLLEQLFKSLRLNTSITSKDIKVNDNSELNEGHFTKYSPKRAVIYNASKSTKHAENIILKTLENFDHVYYIASKDIHRNYVDLDLLMRVEEKYSVNLSKFTFIDIEKKWYQR
ncbi:MAG: hypothetical protein WCK31_00365 [bacterium]